MHAIARNRVALIGLVLLCAANASRVSDVKAVKVKYSPAELAQEDGARQVYRRIQAAARLACDEFNQIDLAQRLLFEKCYGYAVEQAVAKVNVSTLTAVHRERNQRIVAG